MLANVREGGAVRLFEALFCSGGCINGACFGDGRDLFQRKNRLLQHERRAVHRPEEEEIQAALRDTDLGRDVPERPLPAEETSEEALREILARMGKNAPEDELNCGACGYDTCREHAVAIYEGLAECEMCLPYTIDQLRRTVRELARSNQQLADAQEALMQSEKLASMGQLAAGIAHEVNNPLGIVLMYAHLLLEENGNDPRLREDLATIVDQADRCKKIVAGLLHFARQNRVSPVPTDLRELVDQAVRTIHMPAGIRLTVEHESEDTLAEIDRDQITQVLMNLVSNAQAAMPDGGRLTIRTSGDAEFVRLTVEDTGVGIPRENLKKIFEPFFTTKQIGSGTGLGLAVTYGIVKMHRGNVEVTSNADPAAGPTGTTFTVSLPRRATQAG